VTIRIEDASRIKQWLYHHFMGVARRVGVRILDGEQVSAGDRLQYFLGELFVYGPLKNVLGFSKVRVAYTAGEAIGPEIFDFYRGLGMNIKQLYGQTEAAVFITMHPDGQVKPDTVGVPAPEVEVEIADSGEVMYRSPGVFVRYHKNDEATAETKTADGWVHTGDAGYFGDDGHLRIIDRAKDVGKLNDGSMFAPKYLENKLKFFPQIKEAVTFGHERDVVTAFINIDLEAVGNWAERQGLAYSGYTDLAGQQVVYDQIQECIEKVNTDLTSDPHLSGSQIHRFLILHKELDADDGELTRTRKVRRRIIAERYGDLIEALYDGRDQVHVEAEVTFEDGRKGKIVADLAIRNTKTTPVPAAAA
jgi:long-chain acyl-CoA synthetase